jgi:hypothetical protein
MFTMQAFKAVAVCTDNAANVRLVSLADGDTEYVLGRAMQASGGKGFACYVLPQEAVRSHAPKSPLQWSSQQILSQSHRRRCA